MKTKLYALLLEAFLWIDHYLFRKVVFRNSEYETNSLGDRYDTFTYNKIVNPLLNEIYKVSEEICLAYYHPCRLQFVLGKESN